MNPVLGGAVGIGAFGGLLQLFTSIPTRLGALVKRWLYVECTVDGEDNLLSWMIYWLSTRPEIGRSSSLRLASVYRPLTPAVTPQIPGTTPAEQQTFFGPGDGEHLVSYRGARFWVTLTTRESNYVRYRIVTLRCRRRHRRLLAMMIDEVRALSNARTPSETRIYLPDGSGQGWTVHNHVPIRSLESLVLAPDVEHGIRRAVVDFDTSADEYRQLGIPHRLGMLFEGPPGGGKSSAALMVAGLSDRALCVLPLGDSNMTDQMLLRLMCNTPPRAVVLVEDADTVFEGRERKAENKLTFSAVLGALDGPHAAEGRIVIITTNRLHELDDALVREGRCDEVFHFGNATADQAERLYRRFFPDDSADDAASFGREWGDGSKSMAAVQRELLRMRGDARRETLAEAAREARFAVAVNHARESLRATAASIY